MQAGFVDPDRDRPSGESGSEPDLLAADPQVSGRRDDPVSLQRHRGRRSLRPEGPTSLRSRRSGRVIGPGEPMLRGHPHSQQ